MSPTTKRDKERLKQLKVRGEEQDRIIRIINGIMENLFVLNRHKSE